MTIEQILSEFRGKFGSWFSDAGIETYMLDSVDQRELQAFLTASLTSFGKSEYERGRNDTVEYIKDKLDTTDVWTNEWKKRDPVELRDEIYAIVEAAKTENL